MKSLLLILPILALALTACQPKTSSAPAPAANPQQQDGGGGPNLGGHVGGVDSGGDNGVNGRNMEDYAVNLQRDMVFNDYVLPIIVKLSETNPRFASDMIHIAQERTWYIIPVSLKNLTAAQIGVRFADEQVQQFALQNLRAIWINQKFYNGFEGDEGRARLILHEILMGVRLMKLKSALDNCYSETALLSLDSSKKAYYKKAREACALENMFGNKDASESRIPGMGTDLKLSGHDYDSIRELGVRLWRSQGEVGKAELDAWLKTNDFRSYQNSK